MFKNKGAGLRTSRLDLPPRGSEVDSLKHSHFNFDSKKVTPADFELRLGEECNQFIMQFSTGFEVLNRFAKVFGKFSLIFGDIAKELEQMVYEETQVLAQRYVFPEGEGISNAALTWMDFMDNIKEVALHYKRAAAESDELANRVKGSNSKNKSLDQINTSLQGVINNIKKLNTEYAKPRDAANSDLISLEKIKLNSSSNAKKQSAAVHKALTRAITDAETFRNTSLNCSSSFDKKIIPELMKSLGIMQASQNQMVSTLNQSMIDFATISSKPAVLQANIPTRLSQGISKRLGTQDGGALTRLFNLLDMKEPLYRYDLNVTVEELRKQQTDSKFDATLVAGGAVDNGDEQKAVQAMPRIFNGTIAEVMEIERLWWGVEEDTPVCFTWLLDNVVALGGCEFHQIFRIAPRVDIVAKIKENMNYGEYDLLDNDAPNVPAELLKHWLRSLKDPLFPSSLYNSCIQIGKMFLDSRGEITAEVSDACLELYNQIPEVNVRMIVRIAGFFQVATDIEHRSLTNMTMQTLSIVFAPNCLRGEKDDMMEFAQNVHNQNAFVHCFLQWCIDSQIAFDYSVYLSRPPSYDDGEDDGKHQYLAQ
jgi:hypothetical protein